MKRRNEGGVATLTVAITLPVIIMLMGLAVDFGMSYAARTEAQSAADAAAIAGAYSYSVNPGAPTPQGDTVAAANANTILGKSIAITNADVTLPACAKGHCVKVDVPFQSPTYFSRIFGWKKVSGTVHSSAEAMTTGSSADCVKPIFVPASAVAGKPAGTLLPDVRPTSPGGALSPGQYYSFDPTSITSPVNYSDGTSDVNSGVSTQNDTWDKCMVTPIPCSGSVNSQPGNMGHNIATDVSQYTDAYNGVGDYGFSHTDTSSSLVTVVLWDDSKVVNKHGNNFVVPLAGFAQIFIDPGTGGGGAVSAHFISSVSCSVTPPAGTGVGGAPLRLVQLP
jgi:Flp pilus assembly protein TadG